MLALFRTDLSKRFANVLFEFLVIVHPLHDEMLRRAADTSLNRLETAIGFFGFADYGPSQFGVTHFGHLLFGSAGGKCAPGRTRVVQVPVLETEGEAAAHGCALTVDRQALIAASSDPAEA